MSGGFIPKRSPRRITTGSRCGSAGLPRQDEGQGRARRPLRPGAAAAPAQLYQLRAGEHRPASVERRGRPPGACTAPTVKSSPCAPSATVPRCWRCRRAATWSCSAPPGSSRVMGSSASRAAATTSLKRPRASAWRSCSVPRSSNLLDRRWSPPGQARARSAGAGPPGPGRGLGVAGQGPRRGAGDRGPSPTAVGLPGRNRWPN